MRVRGLAEAQMRDRIAGHAVRAALKQDEFARARPQVGLDLLPSLHELGIPGARRKRQIQLGAGGQTLAGLLGRAGAGIQVPPVLVNIGEQQIGIVIERVEHPVPMMGVDIDVGDAFEAMAGTQLFDGDPAIVEDTEAGGPVARRMMQPRDGHEGAPASARHERFDGHQGGTDDRTRGIENAAKGRRVSAIEKTVPVQGLLLHELDVLRAVEGGQFRKACRARRCMHDLARQPLSRQFPDEALVAIRAEGVAVAKPIAGNGFSGDNGDSHWHRAKRLACGAQSP